MKMSTIFGSSKLTIWPIESRPIQWIKNVPGALALGRVEASARDPCLGWELDSIAGGIDCGTAGLPPCGSWLCAGWTAPARSRARTTAFRRAAPWPVSRRAATTNNSFTWSFNEHAAVAPFKGTFGRIYICKMNEISEKI